MFAASKIKMFTTSLPIIKQDVTRYIALHGINNSKCQVFDSYVRSSTYALLAIAELPNNELTGIHTLSLPPLLL